MENFKVGDKVKLVVMPDMNLDGAKGEVVGFSHSHTSSHFIILLAVSYMGQKAIVVETQNLTKE